MNAKRVQLIVYWKDMTWTFDTQEKKSLLQIRHALEDITKSHHHEWTDWRYSSTHCRRSAAMKHEFDETAVKIENAVLTI